MHDWKSKGTNIDEFVACLQYLIDVPLDYKPVLGSDDICGFDVFPKEISDEEIFLDIQEISYNECVKLSVDLMTMWPELFSGWVKKYKTITRK